MNIDYTTITSCGECCIGCAKMRADVRNNNQIETILGSWNLDHPQIGEQFQEESDRLIFKIRTDSQDFILKGIPCGVPETTVESNVRAHLFLGNENGMAPKLYPTKTGTYYVSNQSHWFYLMEFSDKMCAGSVAAAVLTKRGNIYKGICIDTDGSIGMCAERNALSTMLTYGESEVAKVVSVYKDGNIVPPCGICREFMMQLGGDVEKFEILLDKEGRTARLIDLLPEYPRYK